MADMNKDLLTIEPASLCDDREVQTGFYQHYKGQNYEVFRTVNHSETEETMVLYRCLYGDFSWWVRPLAMFTETVIVDGEVIPRFNFIGPELAGHVKQSDS
jgi:hypothetical protein